MIRPRHWHRRLRHSLHWRLVALFLMLALAMSAAFLGGMQKALSLGWRDAVRPLLSDYVDRLAADLGSPPDPQRARALVARLPISIQISGPVTQFDSHPGKHANHWSRRDFAPGQGTDHQGDEAADPGNARLLRRNTLDGHLIVFGVGDLDWRRSPGPIGWITLAVLLVLTGAAYAYVRRLLKPLDDIAAGAQRFGSGHFTQDIPVRRHDELGELAGQINTMAHDIHQMLDAKRALLLAISHELRSPLTRARLNTELLPDSVDTQAQRSALLRDLAEMGQLITDLLESERLSSRHASLHLEPTDLGLLVREAANAASGEATPMAHSARVVIDLAITPQLPMARLDRIRINLLLRNLLDNAVRYGAAAPPDSGLGSGGSSGSGAALVEVNLSQRESDLVLTVRDHGPGVDEAQLSRLTEPFFRADASRQRSTGGVGLGLYLCKLVAQAHGGRLACRNVSPGLEVTVCLPIVAEQAQPQSHVAS